MHAFLWLCPHSVPRKVNRSGERERVRKKQKTNAKEKLNETEQQDHITSEKEIERGRNENDGEQNGQRVRVKYSDRKSKRKS